MRTIVVTGTDTDVGKTVFAAALTAALGASYWKPIQAGLADGSDGGTVARLGVPAQRVLPEAYRLATPCSPHRAAEIDGVEIDPARLALPASARPGRGEGRRGTNGSDGARTEEVDATLIVEGAGGVLVPVTRELLFADLFARWGAPVVLIARTGLGTINHSLSSIEALRSRGAPILGVAFVGEPVEDSEATIAAIGRVRRLGRLPWMPVLDAATLAAAFAEAFDPEDFIAPATTAVRSGAGA